MESKRRRQQVYDHRLVLLIQQTGDSTIATRLGVPRSTDAGWLARAPRAVTTDAVADDALAELCARVARLEKRNQLLRAVLRILIAFLRVLKPDLSRLRVPAPEKARLLREVHRTQGVLGLRRVLAIVGLSASRLRAWGNAEQGCLLDDQSSCPKSSPTPSTGGEIAAVRQMATSPDLRHVSTGGLAVLAQRMGSVFASATTWCRLVRERGWRRPRLCIHPAQPKVGIRATKPTEIWHLDTTLIRLLDHTRLYLHAVIDNFSRRILAWRLVDRFDPATSVAVLVEAGAAVEAGAPMRRVRLTDTEHGSPVGAISPRRSRHRETKTSWPPSQAVDHLEQRSGRPAARPNAAVRAWSRSVEYSNRKHRVSWLRAGVRGSAHACRATVRSAQVRAGDAP